MEEGGARANAYYRFGCGCTLVVRTHVARRVCYRPGPVLKRCYVPGMHEHNYFVLGIRLLRWYDAITVHHAALVLTLSWQRKKREKNEKLVVKIQQAAANNIIWSSTCFFFFFKVSSRLKKRKQGKKTGEATINVTYRCTWYTYHSIKDALDNHEQTGGGAGCKRPQQRGTDASFTCASLVLSRRATSPAPAQRTNCRYFLTWSRRDHEKTNLVFRRSPNRGGIVLTSS